MDNITPKERILKKIRAGLLNKTPGKHLDVDLESGVYEDITDPLPETFAKSLNAAGGRFVFCHSEHDFVDSLIDLLENKKWNNLYCWDKTLKTMLDDISLEHTKLTTGLENAEASLTTCECLIARTGSVVTSSAKNSRSLIAVPQAHIVVAWINQVVPDIKDGLKLLANKYGKKNPSSITFITGPSRTADIEMELVTGVHGPKELYVFLINGKSKSK